MSERRFTGIDELIEGDFSCYEYYNSLPQRVRTRLLEMDITTFSELRQAARLIGKTRI